MQETETYQESIFDEIEQHWQYDYASTGQRLVNFLIDTVLLCNFVFSGVIGFVIGLVMAMLGYRSMIIEISSSLWLTWLLNYIVGSIAIVLSYTLIEGASHGRTVGKLITRTQVVREDGSPITLKDAFLRSLCRIVPFEPFSGFTEEPWHDTWTRTTVVKKRKSAW